MQDKRGPRMGKAGPKHSGKPAASPEQMARKRRVAELQKQGLTLPLAQAVANGQLTLNDAVVRLQRDDEAARIARLHQIPHPLAVQIAMGHADLAVTLRTRKIEAQLEVNGGRSIFDIQGPTWSVGLYGQKTRPLVFLRNDRYEVEARDAEAPGAEPELIHKTLVKYAYPAAEYKAVRKHLDYDKELRAQTVEPHLRPQDRYACSNRTIGAWWDAKTQVHLTTAEGEIFSGEVTWFSRFEIGLKTRAGVEVVVFRHALVDASEVRREEKR